MEHRPRARIASDRQRAASRSDPVREPLQPTAGAGYRAAAAVVGDVHHQLPVLAAERDYGGTGLGMLGDVRQRFRDHEVGRRLDRRRIALVICLDLNGHRGAVGEAPHRRAEALFAKDRRVDAAGEVAQLTQCSLQLRFGLGEQLLVTVAVAEEL